jgi:hypothetical protein
MIYYNDFVPMDRHNIDDAEKTKDQLIEEVGLRRWKQPKLGMRGRGRYCSN